MFFVKSSSIYILLHIHLSLKKANPSVTVLQMLENPLLLLKGLHMCIYIDYIEKKKIYPMTSVALE